VRCAPVVASGRYLLVVGGKYGSTLTRRVLVATTAGGVITEWRLAGELPAPVSCPAAVVHEQRLIVIGGCGSQGTDCSNVLDKVWVAPIGDDGKLGAFAETMPLPAPRWHHAAVIAKNHLYVLAGHDAPKVTTTEVWSAHVNRDGSLGKWRTSSPLVNSQTRPSAAVVGDFLFVIGHTTQVAPLN
jgi:N-acetylneuraminic acid mutarotase